MPNIKLNNIVECIVDKPYKGTEQYPNKILISSINDRGNYYDIYYQITVMENNALNLYNNDDLYIVPCIYNRRSFSSYHGKRALPHRQGRKKRYMLPRTFTPLINLVDEDSEPLSSRNGMISISKDMILKRYISMSPSAFRRFMNLNYPYFYIKIKLDLSIMYDKDRGGNTQNGADVPKFRTASDTCIFKCSYSRKL